MATKIHLQKEAWTSWCGQKSHLHKPLRLTTDESKANCEECFIAKSYEEDNVELVTEDS